MAEAVSEGTALGPSPPSDPISALGFVPAGGSFEIGAAPAAGVEVGAPATVPSQACREHLCSASSPGAQGRSGEGRRTRGQDHSSVWLHKTPPPHLVTASSRPGIRPRVCRGDGEVCTRLGEKCAPRFKGARVPLTAAPLGRAVGASLQMPSPCHANDGLSQLQPDRVGSRSRLINQHRACRPS